MKHLKPVSPATVVVRPDLLVGAFRTHGDYLRRVAGRGLAADLAGKVGASDIVQDTFCAASRDLGDYRGQSAGEFRGWLEKILQNRLAFVRRHFRGTAKRCVGLEVPIGTPGHSVAAAVAELVGTTTTPLSRVAEAERFAALRSALDRLGERDRQIICWHSQERQTFGAIAAQLGSTEDAVRKRWARGLIRLRTMMDSGDESR